MSDKDEDIDANPIPFHELKSKFESQNNIIAKTEVIKKGIYQKNKPRPCPPPLKPKPLHLKKGYLPPPPVPRHRSLPSSSNHIFTPNSSFINREVFNFDNTYHIHNNGIHSANTTTVSNSNDINALDLSMSTDAASEDCSSSESTVSDHEEETYRDDNLSFEEPPEDDKTATLHTSVINKLKADLKKEFNERVERPLPPIPDTDDEFPNDIFRQASIKLQENGDDSSTKHEIEKKRSSDYLKKLIMEWAMTEERLIKELQFIVEKYPEYLKECDPNNEKYKDCMPVVNDITGLLQPVLYSHLFLFKIFDDAVYNWNSENPKLAVDLKNSVCLINHSFGYLQKKAELAANFKKVIDNNAEFAKATTRFVTKFLNAKDLFYSKFKDIPGAPSLLEKNQGITMLHYLDIVHQNTMRWTLFSSKYYEAIDSELPEKRLAKKLHDEINAIVTKMNQNIDRNLNINQLAELQRTFERKNRRINCIQPGRWLLKDGMVQRMTRKDLSPRRLILFSDLFLICHPELEKVYDIRPDLMRVEADESTDRENCFSFFSQLKSSIIVCESKLERDEWVTLINQAIEHTKDINLRPRINNEETDIKEEKPFSALWILDHDASMCMIVECCRQFNVLTRRHHCRNCGYVICRLCSGYAPVKSKDFESERVCVSCYYEILNEFNKGDLFPKDMLLWNSTDVPYPPYSLDASEPKVRIQGKITKPKDLFVVPKNSKYRKRVDDLDRLDNVLAYGTVVFKGSMKYGRLMKNSRLKIYHARYDPKYFYSIDLSGFSYTTTSYSDKFIKFEFVLKTGNKTERYELSMHERIAKKWKESFDVLDIKEKV